MASRYQFNEGHFQLPAGLRDRTVHMFAVDDEGPSEFTLVVTRASQVEEHSVDAFAQRLSKELRRGLSRFEMKSDLPRVVGGSAARDLAYTFRSEDQVLHQRQVVLLTQGVEGERNALQVIATSPKALTPEWAERFEALLDSMVLRDGARMPGEAPAQPELPPLVEPARLAAPQSIGQAALSRQL